MIGAKLRGTRSTVGLRDDQIMRAVRNLRLTFQRHLFRPANVLESNFLHEDVNRVRFEQVVKDYARFFK